MILPIYLYGHPVLRKVSEDITPEYPKLKEVIENMKETMYDSDGIGIAAPQVGLNIRLICIDVDVLKDSFPELEGIIKERLNKEASIGFKADLKDKYDEDENLLMQVSVEDIRKFGMIPEFLGRLPILFSTEALTEDMLVKILQEPKNAILKQYQKLLALDEVKLDFTDEALHSIAAKAMKKDTGARALRSIIEEFMLDIMYEIPKDDNIGTVTITGGYIRGTGGPLIEIRQGAIPIK